MFKVSCIQLCSSDCDQDNLKRTTVLIKKAIKQKTDFIITPEVSSKFSLNKKKLLLFATSMQQDRYLKGIKFLAKKYKKWILIGSLIIKSKKKTCKQIGIDKPQRNNKSLLRQNSYV